MLISKLFQMEDMEIWDDDEESEDFSDHIELKERLRRSLYFGKTPKMDRSSLPMTELTVEYFQEAVPRELGKVDMYWASSVSRKACISPCAMMLGMLYIERLRHKNPDYLEKMSSEELFLISMMLASKYLYDEGITEEVYNDEWAESADLDLEDINQLERDFLMAIDWNLFVSEDEFLHVLDAMEEQTALREGRQRGYLTYSDLCALLRHERLTPLKWNILKDVCKVFAVCSLAYTAGTLPMAGSTVTLSLLKTELSAPRPLTFDLLPLSLLIQHIRTSGSSPGTVGVPSMQLEETDSLVSPYSRGAVNLPHNTQESCQTGRITTNNRPVVTPSVSQFLTLTLFKDTLIAFIVGKKSDVQNDTDADVHTSVSSQRGSTLTCHCPVCPLNARRTSRRNKTYSHDIVDHQPRTDLQHDRLHNTHRPLISSGNSVRQQPCRQDFVSDPDPDALRKQPFPWYRGCDPSHVRSCSEVWREAVSVMGSHLVPTHIHAAPIMV